MIVVGYNGSERLLGDRPDDTLVALVQQSMETWPTATTLERSLRTHVEGIALRKRWLHSCQIHFTLEPSTLAQVALD